LWFDHQAEEAANFYTAIFRNSKINRIARYGPSAAEASGQPLGSVMTVSFELDGLPFLALNGGPLFQFTPAISFIADCRDQKELDDLWAKLSEGGEEGQCGWLRDKYGISWQIVPKVLAQLVDDQDPARAERVMQALLKMQKLDIDALTRA
jgi:predicted 3-demethylubiquinone-9 3-methyltransferase (glyoxalase superfamily)